MDFLLLEAMPIDKDLELLFSTNTVTFNNTLFSQEKKCKKKNVLNDSGQMFLLFKDEFIKRTKNLQTLV